MTDETNDSVGTAETTSEAKRRPQKKETSPPTVGIAYGPGVTARRAFGHEWNRRNGWVQQVDLRTAADLLTYPRGGFKLAERPSAAVRRELAAILGVRPDNLVMPDTFIMDQPTVAGITGPARAQALLAFGIESVADLAALDDEGIERLVRESGASRAEIMEWVQRAQGR